MVETIGVIGLGAMGKPIARHFIEDEYQVSVSDVRSEPVEELVAVGAKAPSSLKELAATTDIVYIVVETEEQVETVIFGDDGLVTGDHGDLVIVICSTVSPELCHSIAERTPDSVRVADAPLCRGDDGARAGTLLVLVGGEMGVYDRIEPSLTSIAEPEDIHHMGELGLGQVAKTANNALLWTALVADAEIFELCEDYGMDIDTLTDALSKSSGMNWGVNNWSERYPRVIPWAHKDMRIAIDMAERRGKTMPLGGLVRELVRDLQSEWGSETSGQESKMPRQESETPGSES